MELWIRSQNKTFLVKADNVVIDDDGLSLYTYANIDCNDITYELGTYKTKERALEVLDEIQRILQPTLFIKDDEYDFAYKDGNIYKMNVEGMKNSEIQELSTYVYEMPEE